MDLEKFQQAHGEPGIRIGNVSFIPDGDRVVVKRITQSTAHEISRSEAVELIKRCGCDDLAITFDLWRGR